MQHIFFKRLTIFLFLLVINTIYLVFFAEPVYCADELTEAILKVKSEIEYWQVQAEAFKNDYTTLNKYSENVLSAENLAKKRELEQEIITETQEALKSSIEELKHLRSLSNMDCSQVPTKRPLSGIIEADNVSNKKR